MSASMYEVFNWDEGLDGSGCAATPLEGNSCRSNSSFTRQGTRLTKSRDSSIDNRSRTTGFRRRQSANRNFWVTSSCSGSLRSSHVNLSSPSFSGQLGRKSNLSGPSPAPPSSTGSNGSRARPSRFSLWEFGDNFSALGPSSECSGTSHGRRSSKKKNLPPTSQQPPSSCAPLPSPHYAATAPCTPTEVPFFCIKDSSHLPLASTPNTPGECFENVSLGPFCIV